MTRLFLSIMLIITGIVVHAQTVEAETGVLTGVSVASSRAGCNGNHQGSQAINFYCINIKPHHTS